MAFQSVWETTLEPVTSASNFSALLTFPIDVVLNIRVTMIDHNHLGLHDEFVPPDLMAPSLRVTNFQGIHQPMICTAKRFPLLNRAEVKS